MTKMWINKRQTTAHIRCVCVSISLAGTEIRITNDCSLFFVFQKYSGNITYFLSLPILVQLAPLDLIMHQGWRYNSFILITIHSSIDLQIKPYWKMEKMRKSYRFLLYIFVQWTLANNKKWKKILYKSLFARRDNFNWRLSNYEQ